MDIFSSHELNVDVHMYDTCTYIRLVHHVSTCKKKYLHTVPLDG